MPAAATKTRKAGPKETEARKQREAKAEPKTAAAPKTEAEEAGPSGDEISRDLLSGIREAVGRFETVDKQAYKRLMQNGRPIAYVRPSKKAAMVTVELKVSTPEDAARAIALVKLAAGK